MEEEKHAATWMEIRNETCELDNEEKGKLNLGLLHGFPASNYWTFW